MISKGTAGANVERMPKEIPAGKDSYREFRMNTVSQNYVNVYTATPRSEGISIEILVAWFPAESSVME